MVLKRNTQPLTCPEVPFNQNKFKKVLKELLEAVFKEKNLNN